MVQQVLVNLTMTIYLFQNIYSHIQNVLVQPMDALGSAAACSTLQRLRDDVIQACLASGAVLPDAPAQGGLLRAQGSALRVACCQILRMKMGPLHCKDWSTLATSAASNCRYSFGSCM